MRQRDLFKPDKEPEHVYTWQDKLESYLLLLAVIGLIAFDMWS